MNIGQIIMEIAQYGDIHEAPWPREWFDVDSSGMYYTIKGMDENQIMQQARTSYSFIHCCNNS
jgi:hypothetical protein